MVLLILLSVLVLLVLLSVLVLLILLSVLILLVLLAVLVLLVLLAVLVLLVLFPVLVLLVLLSVLVLLVLLSVLVLLVLLLLAHGHGETQIVAGVCISGVQSQGFFVRTHSAFCVLAPQKQVAHIVPCVGFYDGVFRQGGSPLKGLHGIFITSASRQCESSVECKLPRLSGFPSFCPSEKAVSSGIVSVHHGLRPGDSIPFGSLL